jgi:hypothetical protein
VSAVHVVMKPGSEKIRVCTEAAASGLNDDTDMEQVTRKLDIFSLPNQQCLANL